MGHKKQWAMKKERGALVALPRYLNRWRENQSRSLSKYIAVFRRLFAAY